MPVKYHIIKPNYSKSRRGVIILLVNLLAVCIIVVIGLLFARDSNIPLLIVLMLLGIISVPAYYLGKQVLKYKTIGKLTFNDDNLVIETQDTSTTINYEQIERIVYRGNLPERLIVKIPDTRKSYLLNIKVRNLDNIQIEVTRDNFDSKDTSIIQTLENNKAIKEVMINRAI